MRAPRSAAFGAVASLLLLATLTGGPPRAEATPATVANLRPAAAVAWPPSTGLLLAEPEFAHGQIRLALIGDGVVKKLLTPRGLAGKPHTARVAHFAHRFDKLRQDQVSEQPPEVPQKAIR